jgi:hypothetical protein
LESDVHEPIKTGIISCQKTEISAVNQKVHAYEFDQLIQNINRSWNQMCMSQQKLESLAAKKLKISAVNQKVYAYEFDQLIQG